MKNTSGISRLEASKASEPNAWTNTRRRGSQPRAVGGLAADGLVYRYDPAAAPSVWRAAREPSTLLPSGS